MPIFSIETDKCLGMSHTGAVTIEGESTVELTDDEVNTLVQLIREKHTADVNELKLRDSHPALYEKLFDAYYQMAYDAEEEHWLWVGFSNGYFDYSIDEVKAYCKEHCGYVFERDEEDSCDDDEYDEEDSCDDDEYDEDMYEDMENEHFASWLEDYVYGLPWPEARKFFYDQLNADLDLNDIDFTVEIPAGIIALAQAS